MCSIPINSQIKKNAFLQMNHCSQHSIHRHANKSIFMPRLIHPEHPCFAGSRFGCLALLKPHKNKFKFHQLLQNVVNRGETITDYLARNPEFPEARRLSPTVLGRKIMTSCSSFLTAQTSGSSLVSTVFITPL